MRSTFRTSAALLASAAAVTGLSIIAPSTAIAGPMVAVGTSAASPSSAASPADCKPAHKEGRDWHWHDAPQGGHWDHRQWDDGKNGAWQHLWSDDKFCDVGTGHDS